MYVINEWSLMLGEKKYNLFLGQCYYIALFCNASCERLQPIFKQFVYLIKHYKMQQYYKWIYE